MSSHPKDNRKPTLRVWSPSQDSLPHHPPSPPPRPSAPATSCSLPPRDSQMGRAASRHVGCDVRARATQQRKMGIVPKRRLCSLELNYAFRFCLLPLVPANDREPGGTNVPPKVCFKNTPFITSLQRVKNCFVGLSNVLLLATFLSGGGGETSFCWPDQRPGTNSTSILC